MASPRGLRGINGQFAAPPFTNKAYVWSNAPGDEYPRGQTGSYTNTPYLDFNLYASSLTMPARAGAIRMQLTRTADYPITTWDGNADTTLKVYNLNAAANAAGGRIIALDFQARSNALITQVSGIEGNTRVSSGATATTMYGILHTCEIYGTVSTTLYGMKIDMRNEGAAPTTSAAIHLTNSNASLATAIGAAISVTKGATNLGFDYLIDSLAADCINTAVLRVYDDGTVCNDTNATGTFATYQKGYLTVIVGTATRYIWLADTAPTA
jgi:hypothetical protein